MQPLRLRAVHSWPAYRWQPLWPLLCILGESQFSYRCGEDLWNGDCGLCSVLAVCCAGRGGQGESCKAFPAAGCSVLGFILYNAAIGNIGASQTNTFVGISTVVSIVAGVLVLHESFTLMQIIGTVIILAGVYLANSRSII